MKKINLILNLLTPKEKKLFYILIILTLVSMFLEIVGLSTIIPLISVLLKNDLNNFYEFLNISNLISNEKIVPYTLILIGLIFVIKNLYLCFFANFLVKYGMNTGKRLSQTLYEGYINLSYLKFIEKTSSKLIYNSTRAIDIFRDSIGLITLLITECLVLFGILIFLFIIDPYTLSIMSAVIFSVFILLYFLNKKKNISWGKQSQFYETARVKTIIESFNAIKDLKIKNIQSFFFKEHENSNNLRSEFAIKHNFNIYIPRLFFEVVILFCILTIVFILRELNFTQEEMITKIGLFTAAAFRLYPSSFKIINSIQNFNFGTPSLEDLKKEISQINSEKEKRDNIDKKYINSFNFESLQVKNLFFKFPEKKEFVLNDCNFKISSNQIIGIKGTTGSGKSTFIDILAGLLQPERGTFTINDKNYNYFPDFWKQNISYVSQNIALLDDSIKKNITFGEEKEIDEKWFEKVIEISQLLKLSKSSPEGIDAMIGDKGVKISGGEKQRIGIARALYFKKPFLIMDEATNALDESTELKIMSAIKTLTEITILIISHKKNTLQFCDQIYEIQDGKLKK